jgi:hypothetical protein
LPTSFPHKTAQSTRFNILAGEPIDKLQLDKKTDPSINRIFPESLRSWSLPEPTVQETPTGSATDFASTIRQSGWKGHQSDGNVPVSQKEAGTIDISPVTCGKTIRLWMFADIFDNPDIARPYR